MSLYVHFGCGHVAPGSWENFDASPTLRIERLPVLGRFVSKNARQFPANVRPGNVVRGLPVTDGSADGVYCSNILEHLTRGDFDRALANTFRMLKPGGIFRLIVPDLETYARRYVSNLGSDTANDAFMRSTLLGEEKPEPGLMGILTRAFGNSRHLWMWDYPSMSAGLARAGFVAIRRSAYGDCTDPRFLDVEDERQFDASALAVEAQKPRA